MQRFNCTVNAKINEKAKIMKCRGDPIRVRKKQRTFSEKFRNLHELFSGANWDMTSKTRRLAEETSPPRGGEFLKRCSDYGPFFSNSGADANF